MTDFGICLTCPEIVTGRQDSAKGWQLDASSNHMFCDVKPFKDVVNLPPPIRQQILLLGAGLPSSDNVGTLFKLGLELEPEWTPHPFRSTVPAVMPTSETSSAPALESVVSTRSQPALTPTSTTDAPVEVQLDLFGGAA